MREFLNRIPSRPHLQGTPSPLRVRHSPRNLTDGGALILIQRLWDAPHLGSLISRRAPAVGGRRGQALGEHARG